MPGVVLSSLNMLVYVVGTQIMNSMSQVLFIVSTYQDVETQVQGSKTPPSQALLP